MKREKHRTMRISTQGHEGRSLALPVAAPVFQEYNHLQLRKQNRRRRIDHLVLSQLPVLAQSHSESSRRARWEQSLDRYILAREQLQSKRLHPQSCKFQFLRLNKINQYRKIKLVEAQSLPLSIIDTTDLHENYSFQVDPELTKPRRGSQEKLEKGSPKAIPQQQRIMNSILENYFKKKYSQQQTHKSYPLRSEKYATVMLKKQKQKLKF